MASAGTAIPEKNNLADLANLVSLFTGKSGNTSSSSTSKNTGGTTTTTKANITAEGMQELINQALAGPGGIQQIANAEHSAGLYGGSTATLLTNNLVTQTAAKLAAAQAGTTTTTDDNRTTTTNQTGTSRQDPSIDPLKAGGLLAGGQVLSGLLSGLGVGGTGSIADLLKGAGQGAGSFLSNLLKGSGPAATPPGTDLTVGNTDFVSGGLSSSPIGLPNLSDLSGLSQIPISSFFPSTGDNNNFQPSFNFLQPNTDSPDLQEETPVDVPT